MFNMFKFKYEDSEKPAENKVAWLKEYVNCPEFIDMYKNPESIEMVAKATFWSVSLGLSEHIKKMNYSEIRTFSPVEEIFKRTERAPLIRAVGDKLAPAMSHEISYGIQQAAWAIYVKNVGFAAFKEQDTAYEKKCFKM